MAQVVILISTLLLADLHEPVPAGTRAADIIDVIRQCEGKVIFTSATPNPDQEKTQFVSISLMERADECARMLQSLDGVLAAYVKPGEFLP